MDVGGTVPPTTKSMVWRRAARSRGTFEIIASSSSAARRQRSVEPSDSPGNAPTARKTVASVDSLRAAFHRSLCHAASISRKS